MVETAAVPMSTPVPAPEAAPASFGADTASVRLRRRTLPAALAIVGLVLAGCQTVDNKTLGTIIGGVAGAAAGSAVGKGSGNALAILIGAGIGAAIGNQVGGMLDEQQQQEVVANTGEALETKRDGETEVWNDPKGGRGASASSTPSNTRKESQSVDVVRNKEVAAPAALDLSVNGTHITTASLRVRSSPNANAAVLETLAEGETIHVVGKVQGTEFYMLARDNRSIGYGSERFLEQVRFQQAGTVAAASPNQGSVRTPVDTTGKSPAEAKQIAARSQGVQPKDLGKVEVDKVPATTTCRDVETVVTVDGRKERAKATACRGPDGAWVVRS